MNKHKLWAQRYLYRDTACYNSPPMVASSVGTSSVGTSLVDTSLERALVLADINRYGQPQHTPGYIPRLKQAVRELSNASLDTEPAALFILGQIHRLAGYPAYSRAEALRYILLSAHKGYVEAAFAAGEALWRKARKKSDSLATLGFQLEAGYWLMVAAACEHARAKALLNQLAPEQKPLHKQAAFIPELMTLACSRPSLDGMMKTNAGVTDDLISRYLLAARLRLAQAFGLSYREALLIDALKADCGHALLVDLNGLAKRYRSRIVWIRCAQQRAALDNLCYLMSALDYRADYTEGSYRQRQYRLKRCSTKPLRSRPRCGA